MSPRIPIRTTRHFQRRRTTLAGTALTLFLLLSTDATATCWEAASKRYGISADLLHAIARVESNLDPRAVNRSHIGRTRSYDIGLMQINSSHLPRLAQMGISERDLYDACLNLHVGAWILADIFARKGVSWDSVGAYNASCSRLRGNACTRARARYAWRVYRRLPSSTAVAAESRR